MRVLSSATASAVANQVTKPFFVMQLGFPSNLFYSTRGTVSWNSVTWTGVDAKLNALNTDRNGTIRGSIEVANHDNVMSALVLNHGVQNRECKIWKLYGDGPFAVEDAVQVFDGVMDGVPGIGNYVQITIASEGLFSQYTPRILCSPPTFNHLPPRGTIIFWEGDNYELIGRK